MMIVIKKNILLLVGIGAALCISLAEAGMIVCGLSKRKDKMEVWKVAEMLLCTIIFQICHFFMNHLIRKLNRN